MKKLAIITTHPIQYYAPVFKLFAQRKKITIKVFYTWGEASIKKHDPGFDRRVEWDIPLLDGYDYEWINNTSKQPGSHHFNGIITPGLISRLKQWDPDAILIFGWAYQSHLKVMRHFKNKIPVYFRGDSTLLGNGPGLKAWIKTLFLKWVYRHADHAFYVGTNNKKYFLKYGMKERQLTFAPHAVDNKRFAESYQGHDLRSILKIPADAIVVLYAGKLEPVKNVGLLLSAFIKSGNKATHLIIIGNGPDKSGLEDMALRSEMNGNIHFMGFQNQSQMPGVYHSADLFCLPSRSETWGLAVNEAMACGKAVLVSDKVGCAVDLVTDKNGLIFKNADAEDLKRSLLHLLSDKRRLEKMGRASADIIKSWDFDSIALAIEKQVNKTDW